ncbi:lysoplasmalogenase [Niabella sp. CC-SYL272]|uniref:lysoplasmalogenase n=1 Tax=Niabella agricola TaxID=2891571 RepID=UPI001F1CEEED|nr:lysoplasmalogenase [Niabella agricola]MCF3111172.1 lysoplasmalogenase [Niabella agricola]
MKPVAWHIAFICVVVLYFLAMALQNDALQFLLKPLLVSTLLGGFISATAGSGSPFKKWVVGALVCSVGGDTLLMFANDNERYFILGLVCFLIAHIFYILCFHFIKVKASISGKWYTAIIVGVYYFFIMSFLLPHLGVLKIPVLIYGVVISFMLLLAMHLYDLPNHKTARIILTGAVFFAVSDSVLAVNKFHHPVAWGGWAIMGTYTLAQWLLTRGMTRYIREQVL